MSLGPKRKALGMDALPGAEVRQSGLCQAKEELGRLLAFRLGLLLLSRCRAPVCGNCPQLSKAGSCIRRSPRWLRASQWHFRTGPVPGAGICCLLLPFPALKSQCHPTDWRERNSRAWGLSLQVQHCPHPNLPRRGSRNAGGESWAVLGSGSASSANSQQLGQHGAAPCWGSHRPWGAQGGNAAGSSVSGKTQQAIAWLSCTCCVSLGQN